MENTDSRKNSNDTLMGKWLKMKRGEWTVVSDTDLDDMGELLTTTPDEDMFFSRCISIPNPRRLGILDKYLAKVKY